MKSPDGRLGGLAGEQADGEVERSPPRVDRGRAAAVGRPERGEDLRRARRRRVVRADLGGVVGGVLLVRVERDRPRDLLRLRVERHVARERADRVEHVARDRADRPVRGERDPRAAAVGMVHDRLVGVQVEDQGERAGPVRGGQRQRLPAADGQPQRRMLELRLRRREHRGQLPEHLRVGVEGVARRAPPRVVRQLHRRDASALDAAAPRRYRCSATPLLLPPHIHLLAAG